MPRKSTVKNINRRSSNCALYRYWLVTPVLQYVSIVNGTLCDSSGCCQRLAMSLLRLPGCLGVCVDAGLLLGGTWAPGKLLTIPDFGEWCFESHLESFWRQIIILTVTITVSGFASLDS